MFSQGGHAIKRKKNYYLSDEAVRLLNNCAFITESSKSSILDALIRKNLSKYENVSNFDAMKDNEGELENNLNDFSLKESAVVSANKGSKIQISASTMDFN